MPPKLEHLETTESLLLMYLSDELSAKDRAMVDQLIATDLAFAAQLERVRSAAASFSDAFRQADAGRKLPVKQEVAVRRVSRAIHDWQVGRAAAAASATPNGRTFRFPWWSYPAAVAASVITGFLIWSTNQKIVSLPPEQSSNLPDDADLLADQLSSEFDPTMQIASDQQWQEFGTSTWDETGGGVVFPNPFDER